MTVISDSGQVTPAYLTAVLTTSGALLGGRVAQVEVAAEGSTWGQIVRVRLHYTADARGTLPAALLMKLCSGTFGRSEVDYLAHDYVDVLDAPLPRCYDAQYDATLPGYHLLMDDLSATHRNSWEVTPTLERGIALVDAVAALHAAYWQQEQRAKRGFSVTANALDRYLGHIRPGVEPLLAHTSGAFELTWHAAIHSMFEQHPLLMHARLHDQHGITLIHGDLNPGNILVPREGTMPVFLIDRQPFDWSLTVWLGVSDLAYAIVHWWPTEQRRAYEAPRLYLGTALA